jgi:hypothetical protein
MQSYPEYILERIMKRKEAEMEENRPAEEARPIDVSARFTNFEKIKYMSDVELTIFLATWEANSIESVASGRGRELMGASQILTWLRSKNWDCRETDTSFMDNIPPFEEK